MIFAIKTKTHWIFGYNFQKKRLVFLEKRSSSFFLRFIGRKKLCILIENLVKNIWKIILFQNSFQDTLLIWKSKNRLFWSQNGQNKSINLSKIGVFLYQFSLYEHYFCFVSSKKFAKIVFSDSLRHLKNIFFFKTHFLLLKNFNGTKYAPLPPPPLNTPKWAKITPQIGQKRVVFRLKI